MSLLSDAQATAQINFNDELLLLRALTHRSYLNEVDDHPVTHNERLEFLGDAVIDFIVGEHLFETLPQRREGELSALRAALVRTEALATFAQQISLGDFVLMGRGEESSGGRSRASLLADVFEAVVAALYLDQGMEAARRWVTAFVAPMVQTLVNEGGSKDAKSLLQEIIQAETAITPIYEVVTVEGPDHERIFTTHVLIDGEVRGVGRGRSKQLAAQAAAQAALDAMNPHR
ncbi:MAG: ribonuclease III [Anaerolineales bacterium]|nr:ribonuclease III [Anaerolineales bacterium]MCB9126764.1 ribonuclease III [Ardenticatenales bacterium]